MILAERIAEVDQLRKRVSGIDNDGWDHIKEVTTLHHFPAGHLFIKPLQPCTKMGYVVRGLLMSYIYDTNGDKDVSQFFMNKLNLCVTDFEKFDSESNTHLSFITLLPTTMLCIEKPEYLSLHLGVRNIDMISKNILYDSMVKMNQYYSDKRNINDEKFVLWFYNLHPILFNKKIVERKFLSSYLGVGKDFITKTLNKHSIII